MKNPTKLHEVAKEKTGTGITSKSTAYEPAHVRKAKNMERFRDGGDGMTRDEKEAAAARKSFRKPKATSRVGQFDEFASGEALPGGDVCFFCSIFSFFSSLIAQSKCKY